MARAPDFASGALLILQVVCSTVRRVWMVLVGLLAFVVGLTTTLLVLKWPLSPEWFEAIGTWFGGLITAVVGIVAFLAYFSEDQARKRTYQREREAIEQARRDDEEQLQLAANQVLCDPRPPVSTSGPAPGIVRIREFGFDVDNKSDRVVTGVVCELRYRDHKWREECERLEPGQRFTKVRLLDDPLEVDQNWEEILAGAKFTYWLNETQWSRRFREPAQRVGLVAGGLPLDYDELERWTRSAASEG